MATEGELLIEQLRRLANAEEDRNALIREDQIERRESWAASEARQEAALARILPDPTPGPAAIVVGGDVGAPVDPHDVVTWLEDPDYDRLYWAIAGARGRAHGSTTEDEELGRAIIAELRKRPVP
jgi:hypothetical protein